MSVGFHSSDATVAKQVRGKEASSHALATGASTDPQGTSLQILAAMLGGLQDIQSQASSATTEDATLSDTDLEMVLAVVASLAALIQQWEAHFESQKGVMDSQIGRQFIDSAKDNLDKVQQQIQDEIDARHSSSIWDTILDVVECVVGAILCCIPGCEAFGVMMLAMFAMDKLGVTAKIAEGLKSLGMSDLAANILASVILSAAAAVGTGGASLLIRAASSAAKIAEAASKEAVKATIREVVVQAVKTAVETVGKEAPKEMLVSEVKQAAQKAAQTAAAELSEVFGTDVVDSSLKEGLTEGITQGLKEAGVKLSARFFIRESTVIEKIAEDVAEETTKYVEEATDAPTKFAYEEVKENPKAALEDAVKSLRSKQNWQILKQAAYAGGTQLMSSLMSTGVTLQLAEVIAEAADADKKTKAWLAAALNLILTVVVAAASMKGGAPIEGLGRSIGKVGVTLHKMSTWAQRIGQGIEIGIGGAKIDTAIKVFDIEKELAVLKGESVLYNALASFQGEMMKSNQKQFDEMQKAIPAILQDAISIAQEMSAAAQEELS